MEHDSVTNWMTQLKDGDNEAAQRIWERYYSVLVRVAKSKLRQTRNRIGDEDDVIVDAFASFCRGVQANRFPQINDRDDLWQILVMLTQRKAINQVKKQNRKKRGAGQVRGDSIIADREIQADTPTPEFAYILAEELQGLLDRLETPELRQIALLKFQGYQNIEIASQMDCVPKTIQRKLQIIRVQLAECLNRSPDES